MFCTFSLDYIGIINNRGESMNPEQQPTNKLNFCANCGSRLEEQNGGLCIHCGYKSVASPQTMIVESNEIKPMEKLVKGIIATIGFINLLPMAYAAFYALLLLSYVLVIEGTFEEIITLLPQYFLLGGYIGASFGFLYAEFDLLGNERLDIKKILKKIFKPGIILGILFAGFAFLCSFLHSFGQ